VDEQLGGYWLSEKGFAVGDGGNIDISGAKPLPVVNRYRGSDGGYIALYTRDPNKAVYSVGGGIYVVGVVRLKGGYVGRVFHPHGYLNQDISAAQEFKDLCRELFDVEGWAGGDTGGWFHLG
jgi:hypothetical protein